MTATLEDVRKKFVDSILRGDYISNQIGSAIQAGFTPEIGQLNIPSFVDTYGVGGEKVALVSQKISSWGLDLETDNLEGLLKLYPELYRDVDYADHLGKKFRTELEKIYTDLRNDRDAEVIEQQTTDLFNLYMKIKKETGGFLFENDKEYLQCLEQKRAEANQPPEGDRK